jgi:hypothetical protein
MVASRERSWFIQMATNGITFELIVATIINTATIAEAAKVKSWTPAFQPELPRSRRSGREFNDLVDYLFDHASTAGERRKNIRSLTREYTLSASVKMYARKSSISKASTGTFSDALLRTQDTSPTSMCACPPSGS